MTAFRELLDKTRSYGIDASNKETAARVWSFDTVDRDSALYELSTIGVGLGSTFPDRPSLRLDRFDVSAPIDGSLIEITALYSSDRSFAPIPEPDKLNPLWYRLNATTRIVERAYPLLVYRAVTIGNLPTGQRQWMVEKRIRDETEEEFSVSVVVDAWSMERENAITNQVGKVHTIAGRQSLFMGHALNGQINASSQQYEVQYTWRIDFGTPVFPPIDDPRQQLPIARPPFYTYTTREVDDPTLTSPSAIVFTTYTFDPQGWQSLPGMVPL